MTLPNPASSQRPHLYTPQSDHVSSPQYHTSGIKFQHMNTCRIYLSHGKLKTNCIPKIKLHLYQTHADLYGYVTQRGKWFSDSIYSTLGIANHVHMLQCLCLSVSGSWRKWILASVGVPVPIIVNGNRVQCFSGSSSRRLVTPLEGSKGASRKAGTTSWTMGKEAGLPQMSLPLTTESRASESSIGELFINTHYLASLSTELKAWYLCVFYLYRCLRHYRCTAIKYCVLQPNFLSETENPVLTALAKHILLTTAAVQPVNTQYAPSLNGLSTLVCTVYLFLTSPWGVGIINDPRFAREENEAHRS